MPFTLNPILKDQVLKSSYFKALMSISSVDTLADEMPNMDFTDTIDVYQAGSAQVPSVFFCCVFRLNILEHSEEDLQVLFDHREVFARCVGFLYARFAIRPDRLWDLFEEYVLDEMDMGAFGGNGMPSTLGEFVEYLLIKEKYFGLPMPRLPVALKRKLEEKLAPLPQYRKRSAANRRELRTFREAGTAVLVCQEGTWLKGSVLRLDSSAPSRLKLAVRLEERSDAISAHLGKVILRDDAEGNSGSDGDKGATQRGHRRRRSPDWSRWKGKSDVIMIQELREQTKADAVCSTGKDYARRPMGFEAGLAIKREQGSAETKLIEEDTLIQRSNRRRRGEEEEEEERQLAKRRSDAEQERQKNLRNIFEKYGQQGLPAAPGASRATGRDVEAPDVMRLG